MTTQPRKTAAEIAVDRAWAKAKAMPHNPDDPACRCLPCNGERARREHLEAAGRNTSRRARRGRSE